MSSILNYLTNLLRTVAGTTTSMMPLPQGTQTAAVVAVGVLASAVCYLFPSTCATVSTVKSVVATIAPILAVAELVPVIL